MVIINHQNISIRAYVYGVDILTRVGFWALAFNNRKTKAEECPIPNLAFDAPISGGTGSLGACIALLSIDPLLQPRLAEDGAMFVAHPVDVS